MLWEQGDRNEVLLVDNSLELSMGEVMTWDLQRGAIPRADGSVSFRVWAQRVKEMAIQCVSPKSSTIAMGRNSGGVFTAST
jgi:hypothetical protein